MRSDDLATMEALDACFPCRPRPVSGELLQAYCIASSVPTVTARCVTCMTGRAMR